MASPARPPFAFSPRTLKLNWRSVAAIDIADVEQRAARGDVDVLESHLETVHFADTTDEPARAMAEPAFIKLFQLSQLTVQYMASTQEDLRAEYEKLAKELAKLKGDDADPSKGSKARLVDVEAQNVMLKKELKLQRKTIATYEQRLTKVMEHEQKVKRKMDKYVKSYVESELDKRSAMPPTAGPSVYPYYPAHAQQPAAAWNPYQQTAPPPFETAAPAGSGRAPQGAQFAGAPTSSNLASNAGELESDVDEYAGMRTRAERKENLNQKLESVSPVEVSERMRRLYRDVSDDVTIKLDAERQEFARREDLMRHQHRLETNRMESEMRDLKMSYSGSGGMGLSSSKGVATTHTRSNVGFLEDDSVKIVGAGGKLPSDGPGWRRSTESGLGGLESDDDTAYVKKKESSKRAVVEGGAAAPVKDIGKPLRGRTASAKGSSSVSRRGEERRRAAEVSSDDGSSDGLSRKAEPAAAKSKTQQDAEKGVEKQLSSETRKYRSTSATSGAMTKSTYKSNVDALAKDKAKASKDTPAIVAARKKVQDELDKKVAMAAAVKKKQAAKAAKPPASPQKPAAAAKAVVPAGVKTSSRPKSVTRTTSKPKVTPKVTDTDDADDLLAEMLA